MPRRPSRHRWCPATSTLRRYVKLSTHLTRLIHTLPQSVASAHAFDTLPSGTYNIYNAAWGSAQLRSYSTDQPIFVSLTREWPGEFGQWKVEKRDDSNLYTITNIGLSSPVHSSNDLVVPGPSGDGFSIEQAGDNVFTIRVPNEDKVWTVNTNTVRSDVHLEGQVGTTAQLWRFVPVDY
ncbi:hypothetical protein DFH07DRAFT_787241 [Mycena maculata]|uniref:Uncharacterized protein n=1 Tax=Mycena maculata TaxID=230809 RepID=A0AAD7KGS5_9AGAR|nr:hypothetical protein DFH07DRAFT_787241 [Mycena maculata]